MPYNINSDPYTRVSTDTAILHPSRAAVVVPSDTADFAAYGRVFVGGAGNVVCVPVGQLDETTVTFTGVVAGTILPVRVRRVWATGTTATALVINW